MQSALLIALVAGCACAASISWTGYAGNNQWTTPNNWYPNSVPGPNDDVTIQSGNVYVTIATGVQSLTMGTSVQAAANLTLYEEFFIGSGGLSVFENGNLFIQTGLQTVTGQVSLSGNLFFVSGTISGQWQVQRGGFANLNTAGQKGFSGASFTTQGQLSLSGVVVLNQSSIFTIASTATLSGLVEIQAGDNTAVNFDASQGSVTYTGGATLNFQAPASLGTFVLQSGNVSLFSQVQFGQSLNIPKGSVVTALGTSVTNLAAGLSGWGTLSCMGSSMTLGNMSFASGTLYIAAGNVTFSTASTVGTIYINGGNTFINGDVTATWLHITGGQLFGNGKAYLAGTTINVATAGFTLGAPLVIASTANIASKSLLAYTTGGKVTLVSNGTLNVNNPFELTGPSGTFSNMGVVNVNAAFTLQNIDVSGTGSFVVQSSLTASNINFATSTVQLSGGGTFSGSSSTLSIGAVTATANVQATFGNYQTQCPKQCQDVNTPAQPQSPFTFAAASSRRK